MYDSIHKKSNIYVVVFRLCNLVVMGVKNVLK